MASITKLGKPLIVDDLATLLQERTDHSTLNTTLTRIVPEYLPRQQSKKGTTLEGFIKMLAGIVTKAMKNSNVIFEPYEGTRIKVDQSYPVDNTYICYEVLYRKPFKELKPRERQEVLDVDPDGKARQGRIWGQRFECLVQFTIMSPDYESANKVMDTFEDIIFNYTSYFKENGVAEILFDNQITDHNYDIYRQAMSIRNLHYKVWIEKLYAAFDNTEIDGVIVAN